MDHDEDQALPHRNHFQSPAGHVFSDHQISGAGNLVTLDGDDSDRVRQNLQNPPPPDAVAAS